MRGLRALYLVVVLAVGGVGGGLGAAQADSLGGLVLVASESMPDPRFREAVIYLVDHGEDGAFGFIVNKPGGSGPIAALLDELEIDPGDDAVQGSATIAVHYGGPVAPGRGFVLHSADYAVDGTRAVSDEIALTASAEVLRDIARGRGPRRSLLVFGYCGWGPAQLEGELARGDWAIVTADDDLVLGDDHESKWRRAWRGRMVI